MHISAEQTHQLQGSIAVPASKSDTLRALILATLSPGISTIHRPLMCTDTQDMLRICRDLGSKISTTPESVVIQGTEIPFKTATASLDTGNSGITTRFALPLMGLRADDSVPVTVNCKAQMRERPIAGLLATLSALGMDIRSLQEAEKLPIQIRGKLRGGTVTLNEPVSQFLSALLIALPLASENSRIQAPLIPAQGYVDMTLAHLRSHDIVVEQEHLTCGCVYHIPGKQRYRARNITIESDYTSASYLLAAAVMFPGEITLTGLSAHSTQRDQQLLAYLTQMGADMTCTESTVTIQGGRPLKGMQIDGSDIPDLLPTLAVLGTYAQGETIIHNVPQARLKETDRIHSMLTGLRSLGAQIHERHDGLLIKHSTLTGAPINGFQDHRTIMALTLAGMRASGTTRISDAEAIDKTFPDFVTVMQQLGAQVEYAS